MSGRRESAIPVLGLCFVGALLAAAPVGAVDVLIPEGAIWRYLDDGSDAGSAWREPGFDDTSWALGPAELGYGDGDEATVVSFGPDPDDKYITTYFRRAFMVSDPSIYTGLTLELLRDDGAVVYLNGAEIFRSNMTAGPIDSLTLAASTISGSEETLFNTKILDPLGLEAGTNVLAVEIHQRAVDSSDISLDLQLTGTLDTDPVLVLRGPYLQRVSPGQATVRWRTSTLVDSRVDFGLAADNLDQTATDDVPKSDHAVTLTGLAPNTTYFYGVGTSPGILVGGDSEHFVTTARPAGLPAPTRIWVIGDSGTGDSAAAAVRNGYLGFAGSDPTDVWLMLGDNAYGAGTDNEYQGAVFDMYPSLLRQVPLWPTLGNHDGRTTSSATQTGPYFEIFTVPAAGEAGGLPSGTQAYYSFDHANIHFICLDSQDSDRDAGGAMLTWLEGDLASTNQEWIIAFWHHPPYTKGSHDSDDTGDSGGRMGDMRQNALPILEDGGVDLVLAGHSHSYERSFLLDGHYGTSPTLTPGMIVDDGDGREDGDGPYEKPGPGPTPHEGAVYVVAGCSGQTDAAPLDHPAMFISLIQLGSVVLDVDGSRLDARFLGTNGLTSDDFTILKSPPSPGFIRADADASQLVNLADAILVLAHLFLMEPVPCVAALDVNGDQAVGLVDAIALLIYLFGDGPPPGPPFPGCGDDPAGRLPCDSFPSCP